jgi:hypothetical protein
MFYWSHHDTHVVLSDEEELALVRELAEGPMDAALYDISRKARRRMEKRIFSYFERLLRDDPEAFNRRFVFRSCDGDEAKTLFPVLLNAYGRITHLATFQYGELREVEELLKQHNRPSLGDPLSVVVDDYGVPITFLDNLKFDLYQVILLGRGRWPWSQPEVTGRLCFPPRTLQKLTGTADNFFAATNTLHMYFDRNHVRISTK